MESSQLLLVVDDEPHARDIYELTLTSAGFDVVTAVDGRDALARVEDRLPDLAVTDLHMPNVDGDELARRLRSRHPGLPVVLVTSDPAAAAGLDSSLFHAVLAKPVDPDALVAAVRDALAS